MILNLVDKNFIVDEQDALGLISLGWHGRMPEEFKQDFLKNYAEQTQHE